MSPWAWGSMHVQAARAGAHTVIMTKDLWHQVLVRQLILRRPEAQVQAQFHAGTHSSEQFPTSQPWTEQCVGAQAHTHTYAHTHTPRPRSTRYSRFSFGVPGCPSKKFSGFTSPWTYLCERGRVCAWACVRLRASTWACVCVCVQDQIDMYVQHPGEQELSGLQCAGLGQAAWTDAHTQAQACMCMLVLRAHDSLARLCTCSDTELKTKNKGEQEEG